MSGAALPGARGGGVEREQRGTRATRRLAVFVERRAGAILLATLVCAALAVMAATRLGIDQRLRYLLPSHFPSVSGIDRVTERLGNQSDVYVTIESPSRDANIAFGEAAAARMADRDDLSWVLFRRDYAFFEDNALLFVPLSDLLDLRHRVIERIRSEVGKKAYGEMSLLTAEERKAQAGADPLDEDELRRRYGLDEDPPEYFEAHDGRMFVVKARPTRPDTDLEFSRALQADLEAMVEELRPTSFHPEMTVRLDGAFVQHRKRVDALRGEVIGGTGAAILALLASIAIYFRSVRAVAIILLPLLVSATAALAFAWVVYDKLNLVSAFIFAVLLGLGIDFGIHMLARYRDERGRGRRRPRALAITWATSGKSTLAGGAGTGLAFATLSVADFQGFAQFGVVAAFGIATTLAGALLVMPAALVWSERVRAWPPPRIRAKAKASAGRWPLTLAVALTVGAVLVGAWALRRSGDLGFEYDFGALGPRDERPKGQEPPSYRDAVGKAVTVAPAIGLTEDLEQAESLYRQLSALRAMTPDEARALQPLPGSRAPTLLDALTPEQDKRTDVAKADVDAKADARPAAPAWGSGDDAEEPAADTKQERAAAAADPEPARDPERHPAAVDDDWDAEPEDWDDDDDADAAPPSKPGEADPAAAKPDEDDWAAEPDGDGWDEDDEDDDPFADGDLDDRRFVELEKATAATTYPSAELRRALLMYRADRRADLADRLVAVSSVFAFVPDEQAEKLEVIRDIRRRIDDKRGAMSKKTQGEIDEWYRYLKVDRPIALADLPDWVREPFTDVDGEVGRFVIAWTRGSKGDYLNSRRIYDALGTMATPTGGVGFAAEFFVLPEVFEAIEADAPVVLTLAATAMLITTMAAQGAAGAAAVGYVVGLSVLWLVAFMLAMEWKLNFFNVIVLPLLIGMAQDDALHIFQRWREEGRASMNLVLRETGGAVFLTTLTTVCGFGGILFANHRGLESLAWTAVTGMILALVIAVVVLPAVLEIAARKKP